MPDSSHRRHRRAIYLEYHERTADSILSMHNSGLCVTHCSGCLEYAYAMFRQGALHKGEYLQAYAAARMAESVLRGLDGEQGVFEAAYVESNVVPGLTYFASKVRLGPSGAEEVYGLRNLTEVEKKGIEELTPILKGNIDKGIEFANAAPPAPEKV